MALKRLRSPTQKRCTHHLLKGASGAYSGLWGSLSFALLLALLQLPGAEAKNPLKEDYDKLSPKNAEEAVLGKSYRVDLEDLHPTQFVVGREEVRARANAICDLGNRKFLEYLEKKIGGIVIGPGGKLWLIDGHHLACALIKDDRKQILVKVKKDWSGLSESEFLDRMTREKLLWLYDGNGRKRSARRLPKSLDELGDDPFRSLAWKVEDAGGFADKRVPFQEFEWANYFRKHFTAEELRKDPDQVLKRALELSRSPAARSLPGFAPAPRACVGGFRNLDGK